MDAFISLGLALCVTSFLGNCKSMNVFSFLGKHSSNIYMIHTFIFSYWFASFFYNCDFLYGTGIFVSVMTACIAISIALEFIKEKIGIYTLTKHLTSRI